MRRALQILIALGSFGAKLLLDQRNGVLDRNKRLRAAELRRIFTRLGPTFVKLGQGLSTRPDLCPPEYLEELSQLQVLNSSYSFFFFINNNNKFLCIEFYAMVLIKFEVSICSE